MSSHPLRLSPLLPGTPARLTDAEARLPDQSEVDKDDLKRELDELTDRLDRLQRRLYAEGRRALLVVLQGRDASGKDGTLRKVFGHDLRGIHPGRAHEPRHVHERAAILVLGRRVHRNP